jgi:hypothetical protein
MAIQTLNTIKNWFKTGLKPSQAQFWDTWDSFRHKFEKVPVKDIDGIDELLLTKADKTILDNHLADKIAHAPQVNTDWNSESGFSQLINKPKFKTINGEEIIGDGDITISSAIPTLDQVLNSDNKSLTQPIVFLDEEYSATIDSKNLSIDGPLGEGIQYNGDNINWSKGDKNLKLLFDGESAGQNTFSFPEMPDSSTPYKLATDQVVSATQSGIVDNTSLQELGGVDKLINGVRIGRGNNQDISNVVFSSGYTNEVSTGLRSSALGFGTLNSNTTGNNNTAVGCNALTANTTGPSNTAVGRNALMSNTTASFNSAFGTQSLMFNTTGTLNMAFGSNALYNNTTGNNNVSAGASSLQTNTTGGYNTSLGAYSLYSSNGISNIAIGNMAGSTISTGNNNIIIGATSNSSLTPGSLTTGSNNLVIGPNQGLTSGITTGNGNVVLGKITGLPSDSENTISLSDGIGNVALRKETDNRLLAPGLTNALIDSGGAKSVVTKEYLDAHSGGSSQNLQQTLENGGSAEFSYNGGIQELSMFDGNGAIEFYTSGEDVESGESKTSDGIINKNNIQLRHTYLNAGISRDAYLDVSSGKIRLQEQNNTHDALLEFEDQTGSRSTFQIPNKNPSVDTTYKLATLDDVSLQQTLENGNISSQGFTLTTNPTEDPEIGTQLLIFQPNDGVKVSNWVSNEITDIQAGGTKISDNTLGKDVLTTTEGINGIQFGDRKNTLNLSDRTATGVASYGFDPLKSAGAYTVATEDVISLQKIVDNSASATKENSGINLMAGSGGLANNFMYISNGLSGSDYIETQFKQTPDYVKLALYKGSGAANEFIGISESIGINLYKKGETYETNIAVKEPIANTGILFPAPSIAGNYTLATTADIASLPIPTLQQVISGAGGNSYTGTKTIQVRYVDYIASFGGEYIGMFDVSVSRSYLNMEIINETTANNKYLGLSLGMSRSDGTEFAQAVLAANPNTNTGVSRGVFYLPENSNDPKTLATTDNLKKIIADSSTTAPTTSAELNSLYPNAKEGDEVTFLDSTPYSLICKKLLSGWVMYQVGKLP